MLAAQFHAAAAAANSYAALDNVSRLLWKAHAEACLSDDDAQAAAEAIEGRRQVLKGPRAPAAQKRAYAAPRPCRSPDRARSLARRRAVAASGAMPSRLAASFTLGELAVLSIIAGEVRRNGDCQLCIDAIAAQAGVSRRLAQNAIRQAERLGLLNVEARPRPGQKSLTNIVAIVSQEWRAWLRLGIDRVQKAASHEYQIFNSCKKTQLPHANSLAERGTQGQNQSSRGHRCKTSKRNLKRSPHIP